MTFRIFVDESGSTGPNLNDAAQPVFVHAGLFVPAECMAAVRELATEIKRELLPNSEELHAGVLNSHNGRKRVAPLLRELAAMRVLPLVSIMERRISRATYLVDSCFDYFWNDKADPRFMTSAVARQDLSQLLVDVVPEQMLFAFAAARRRRDPVELLRSLEAVAEGLRIADRADLAEVVIASGAKLTEQCSAIHEVDNVVVAADTLNTASFSVLAAMCERAEGARPYARRDHSRRLPAVSCV